MSTFDFYSMNVRNGFDVELLKIVRCMQKISFFEQISSKAHILSITFGSAINPAKTFFDINE